MQLHNEDLSLGDRVYDISAKRGYGTVNRILPNGLEVKFDRYSVVYDSNGVQKSHSKATLFWDQPLMIAPKKEEHAWSKKKELVGKLFEIVKESAEFI